MKTTEFNIEHILPIHIVWSNTDLTKGKGYKYPKAYCINEVTAKRLAAGNYVKGTDCPITEEIAMYSEGSWYAKIVLTHPTKEDKKLSKKIQEYREAIKLLSQSGISIEELKNAGYL